ncbi:MotA/TolQ/ExbB proton channel family protein [Pelagicoccus mobilis]|uniref:MotA/TolQ/ExbB proton channel family protein n=1 Tax=Pelagicoccus mobilis TaxID=415221 RepID=A0A934S3C6_9BACT|nr:MotA/TolQ/ExbB proton channel family protein [Pelagicoccus mobilis]MBK1879916.1 MotA/TolQ/ExbB proton channel family protein [Pelagicoccus mobilis]
MRERLSKKMTRSLSAFAVSFLLFTGLQPAMFAQDLPEEISGLVESSLQEYLALEQSIATEKTPLVARLSELEESNLKLRSEVESYRFLSQQVIAEIEELGESGKSVTSQIEYVRSALDGFLDKFESRINISETQVYMDDLDAIRAKVDPDSQNMQAEFAGYADAMRLSLQRISRNIGGEVFSGKAIDSEGRIHNGKVLIFGPAGYFQSEDSKQGGVLKYDSGAIEPGITFLPDAQGAQIGGFVETGSGELPLDSTLGDALALQTSKGDLMTHLKQGGYVGFIILALGLIAGVISLLKLSDLAGFYTPAADQVAEISRLAREESTAAAQGPLKEVKGVAGDVLATGVRNINKNALLLEETMLSVILRAKPRMERYLPFLAITAAASPLLGLLGTVVGLIKTFALITLYGAGTPNALSSGISEALITTELGLMVAIPTLILHGLFSRLIRSRIVALEQTAFDFVESTKLEISVGE